MAAPAGWVQSVAIPTRGGPIQYLLDTPAQPSCGFGLFGPDRFENGQYMHQPYIPYHQCTDLGIGVARQRVSPLLSVLGIAPAGLMRSL